MATEIINEKGSASPKGVHLTVTTMPTPITLAEPEKAQYASSTRTPSTYKVSQECPRDSSVSTPRSYAGGNPFDTDIEAIIPTSSSQENCARKSTTVSRNDCQVWPGKEHWKQKAKAAKANNRSCACMGRLSKRTRVIVKVLIALFIIGVAVGVGFGVSKPLGAPIWGKNNK